MTATMEDVINCLRNTILTPVGVTFQGRSLKLDTAADAQIVVDAINNCEDLEFLNLEGNTLGVEAAEAIAKALESRSKFKRALWKDLFTGRMKTEIPKALESLGNGLVKAGALLKELDLSDNAFGPTGVKGLASFIRSTSCYALEELRLNNNGLGIIGGKLLAEALMDCYNSSKASGKALALRVFIAGRNRLENDGAKALAEVFKTLGSLEEIVMPQNGIYHPGILALSTSFTYNKDLQILNLNDNTITPKGAATIANILPTLPKLKHINFGDCLLKTKGALSLAAGLRHVTELEELILSTNEIRTAGGLALIDAIADKKHLRSFILDGNQFSESGKKEIETKLKQIGKYDILGLEDCESEDDEDPDDSEDEDILETVLDYTKKCTFNDFVHSPSAENFLRLGNDRETVILTEIKKPPTDSYYESVFPTLMKVSALTTNSSREVAQSALNCAEKMYSHVFAWAIANDAVTSFTNNLLVHLGLLKSEDKRLKVTWSVRSCLNALEKVIERSNKLPQATRESLRFFLLKELETDAELTESKQRLIKLLA